MRFSLSPRKNETNEKGFLTAEWTLAMTVLLIPAFLIAFSMTQFPSRKHLTQTAAESAAKAYVEVLDEGLAVEAARTAAVEVIEQQYPSAGINKTSIINTGKDAPRGIEVRVTSSSFYCPGSEVTVQVTMPMPFLIKPNGSKSILGSMSSSATERIGAYVELDDSDSGYAINDETKCP